MTAGSATRLLCRLNLFWGPDVRLGKFDVFFGASNLPLMPLL